MTTKKELLAEATELNVAGRHDMTKLELLHAVAEAKGEQIDRYIPTKPYNTRVYGVVTFDKNGFQKLQPQAKQIFNFVRERDYKGTGKDIVKAAVNAGYIKTKAQPDVLFAQYARKLEKAGMQLVE